MPPAMTTERRRIMKSLFLITALFAATTAMALPAAASDRRDDGRGPSHERHYGGRGGEHHDAGRARPVPPRFGHHYGHRYGYPMHHHGHPRHYYPRHRHHGYRIVPQTHHYTDPAAVILGSAAGGLIGHTLGDGDPYATLSGVIVGGAVGYGLGHEHYKIYRVVPAPHRRW